MRKKLITISLILSFTFTAFLAGCAGGQSQQKNAGQAREKGPVTVASMIDAEGAVLGKMMVLVLEDNGFKVNDKTEFGTPDILRKALLGKEVDLVLDYTGSGQYYHESKDSAIWSDAQKGYEMTKKLDREKNNLVWLTPAMANNTEMLSVKKDFAEQNNIRDMQDFAGYINKGGKVKLICSASFAESIRGLPGYEQAYGFKLKKDQLIVLSAGNTAEMLKALVEGTNGVNVSLVYGTDGALDKMNLYVIKDPKSIPPVYLPTPVLRGDLADQYPEIETVLKPVFQSLSLEKLQQLNSRVAFEGRDATSVAKEYLMANGFLSK